MPDLNELRSLLERHGYSLEGPSITDRSFVSVVTGGKLDEISAVIRATNDICNLGVVVGIFDVVPERSRYSLLVGLLELNFDHPLAHTSLVHAPIFTEQKAEPERRGIIVTETSFFWPGLTRERFDARAKALHAITFAASQHLATRDALSNTNPFYHRLKGASSPVTREDFPNPKTANT